MYLSFYGLKRKPFQINTDPSFLWLGEKHNDALAILKYGILENQGFLLLTGNVGTGKTTLINALVDTLGDEVIFAKVPDPGMEMMDFMNYISHVFEMKKTFVSKDAFLIHFGHFLNSAYSAGKKVLLIIDESQRLNSELLEEIRQLSNIEKQEAKLLNIFFIGQNEFNDVLQENKNRALRQRITINYALDPLDEHETGEFVRHRLTVAGAQEDIFDSDAIRSVYEYSGGAPRRINIICDHSLLSGFVQRTKSITSDMVRVCAEDLRLPEFSSNNNVESHDDSKKLNEMFPEALPGNGSRNGWRTMGTVVVALAAVIIVTYIKYPEEYKDLYHSVISNGEMRVVNGSPGGNTPAINSDSQPYTEEIPINDVETDGEIPISAAGVREIEDAQTVSLENVAAASLVPEGDNTIIRTEAINERDPADDDPYIHSIDEDIVIAADPAAPPMDPGPQLDQQKTIEEDTVENIPLISRTETMGEQESGAGQKDQEKETVEVAESTPLPDIAPETDRKFLESADKVDINISDASEKTAGAPGKGDSVIPKIEKELSVKTETNSAIIDPETGHPVSLRETPAEAGRIDEHPEISQAGQLVRLEDATASSEFPATEMVTDSKAEVEEHLTTKISNGQSTKQNEPGKILETDQTKSEEPEQPDPGAVIEWVLKKRSM